MGVKQHLLTTIKKIIRFITRIIPSQKGVWVFGAWGGNLYSDNAKYLFEYINREHQEIEAVWITKNKSICKQIQKQGATSYYFLSLKGIWKVLRAEFAFETSSEADISPFLDIKKTQVIQLWHGIGPKASKWKNEKGEMLFSQKRAARFQSYYWMATSDYYVDMFSKVMWTPKDRFYVTGYPRNDSFVNKPENEKVREIIDRYKGAKFIIYMPTHRNFGKTGNKISCVEDLIVVDGILKNENVYMVYKPHFHELENLKEFEDKFSNIIFAKDQEVWSDAYSYLHYFDLLITDYSSISSDFACSDKPIVLFTFDLDDYSKNDSGLYKEFWEVPFGPFCYTWKETIYTSLALLKEDTWKEKRNVAREKFHKFNDGQNCRRVYEAVCEISEK